MNGGFDIAMNHMNPFLVLGGHPNDASSSHLEVRVFTMFTDSGDHHVP